MNQSLIISRVWKLRRKSTRFDGVRQQMVHSFSFPPMTKLLSFGRSLPLLLSAVEDGIFNDNWRIRQSLVELLGDLLFKVAGTSGKALLEGGSDDEGASTEAHGRAIIEVLGRDKRNEVLAA